MSKVAEEPPLVAEQDPAMALLALTVEEFAECVNARQPLDLESLLGIFDNLAMALEMGGCNEQLARLQRLRSRLEDRSNSQENSTGETVSLSRLTSLLEWMQRLVAILQNESPGAILESAEHAGNPEKAQDNTAPIPLAEVVEVKLDDEDSSDFPRSGQPEVLSTVWQEIAELLPELERYLEDMPSSMKAKMRYCEMLEALADASGYAGLCGVQLFISLLAMRIQDTESISEQHCEAIQRWPAALESYLVQQASEDSCLGLLEILDAAVWPVSLEEDLQQELIEQLVAFVETGESSSEESKTEPKLFSGNDLRLDPAADASMEVLAAFLTDAPKHIQVLFESLASFSEAPADSETVVQVQRACHSLKGSANLLGLSAMANLSHELEALFERADCLQLLQEQDNLAHLIAASDMLSAMLDYLQGRDSRPEGLMEVLLHICQLSQPGRAIQFADEDITEYLNTDLPDLLPVDNSVNSCSSAPPESIPVIQQAPVESAQSLEDLLTLAEEMSINTVQARELYKRVQVSTADLQQHDQRLNERRLELEGLVDNRSMAGFKRLRPVANKGDWFLTQDTRDSEFDPLEMDRYDDLHRCSHQLFEAVADVREVNQKLQQQMLMMDGLMRQQHRYIDTLQHQLLSRQKLQASMLSGRLQRCVRQACRALEKQVNLTILGDDLDVDREVLDGLADPLMHLLRNAVDHGIETAGQRRDFGKPLQGEISLEFQQAGRFLQVKVTDDGAGLDLASIYAKALQRELFDSDAPMPEPSQLAELIWLPGFTTREDATQISGRGIGMDAVRSQIELLGGTIRLNSEDEGTEFVIRLPIREITQYMLLVKVGKQSFAVPTTHLVRILPADEHCLESMGGRDYLALDDELLPFTDLRRLVSSDSPGFARRPILLAEIGGKTMAIAIDQLLTGEQLVVRNPGPFIPAMRGLLGLTILGDGNLVPVLNMQDLLQQKGAAKLPSKEPDGVEKNVRRVLVVDDSLSVRSGLKQLLQDCGFEVETACDGLEAAEMLHRDRRMDLLLVDLEMPRMDGLELTRMVRKDAALAELPIVMLTSRSQDKHRDLARKAGVNAYTTKPYEENKLMDTVMEWIS